jgi:hypothetical protein
VAAVEAGADEEVLLVSADVVEGGAGAEIESEGLGSRLSGHCGPAVGISRSFKKVPSIYVEEGVGFSYLLR